ncbi:ce712b1a-f448-4d1d-a67c-80b61add866c [Thermothielavioides terrestris]|uniref:Ce712b1a-f448-4d1d-a67c-80b61add866c n=1 Tax=Thermothielavioides terrestris TaxID=2587410 RepID=A0A446BLV9_9PEZI|nr:ce712b1a-f448-4d1d-a67c-80b61add866c [Thermothielavioides terrestris]
MGKKAEFGWLSVLYNRQMFSGQKHAKPDTRVAFTSEASPGGRKLVRNRLPFAL